MLIRHETRLKLIQAVSVFLTVLFQFYFRMFDG